MKEFVNYRDTFRKELVDLEGGGTGWMGWEITGLELVTDGLLPTLLGGLFILVFQFDPEY